MVIKNPYDGELIVRKCVGVPKEWIGRKDDGRFVEVPNEHIWVECAQNQNRENDSLSELNGPITSKLVMGTVTRVVWPFWRADPIESILEKCDVFKLDKNV